MMKAQLEAKLQGEKKAKCNAKAREKRAVNDLSSDKDLIVLSNEDHADFSMLMGQVDAGDIPEGMKCLWDQQAKLLATSSKNGYRWHPK